jgi:hypothetical protein
MCINARLPAERANVHAALAAIAGAGTGHGESMNAARTAQDIEKAGLAGTTASALLDPAAGFYRAMGTTGHFGPGLASVCPLGHQLALATSNFRQDRFNDRLDTR